MIFQTSDGVSLYVHKDGNGPPCIYLHGGPGYWSKSFKDFAGDLLAEQIEMIYFDQRGCGRSNAAENDDYTLERLILDIEEIRIQFGYEQWYVMGHSFGGILAVNYALQFPEGVHGLILSNVTLDMKESFISQIRKGRELLGLKGLELSTLTITELVDTFFKTAGGLIEKERFYKLQFPLLNDKQKLDVSDEGFLFPNAFQQFVFSSETYFDDFRKVTSSISCPVLVLSGKYDFAVGSNHHKTFQFKNIVYKELNGGHHLYVENPTAFTNAISDFLHSNKKKTYLQCKE